MHKNGIIRNIGQINIYNEWMMSNSTVYQFMQRMTRPLEQGEVPCDYDKNVFFTYYNQWCEAEKIPREDRVWTFAGVQS